MDYFATIRPQNKRNFSINTAAAGLKQLSDSCFSISSELHKFHNGITDHHIHAVIITKLEKQSLKEALELSLAPHWRLDYLSSCKDPKAAYYYSAKHYAIPVFYK